MLLQFAWRIINVYYLQITTYQVVVNVHTAIFIQFILAFWSKRFEILYFLNSEINSPNVSTCFFVKTQKNLCEDTEQLLWSHREAFVKTQRSFCEDTEKLMWRHRKAFMKTHRSLCEDTEKLMWRHREAFVKTQRSFCEDT